MYGGKLNDSRGSFVDMRHELRHLPNNRVELTKYKDYVKKKNNYWPNENVMEKGDLHFGKHGVWDKGHYYNNLANRLQYQKVRRGKKIPL